MLIVLGCIFIAMIIGGAMMLHCSNIDETLGISGIILIVIGTLAAIGIAIVTLVQIHFLAGISIIDERIAMYKEQNTRIEEQIETVVKQYQEHELGIMTEVGDKESYIILVSLYPELKADDLVSKQIDVYLNNNKTMVDLNNQKLDGKIYRWWLYFGS